LGAPYKFRRNELLAEPRTKMPKAAEALSASMEDYLETIYNILLERPAVRPKDISQRMKVSNSSVTGALRALSEKGLINYAPFDLITLTDRGSKVAKNIVRRHDAVCDFFVKVLSVDPKEADEAACKIEHVISPYILERFINFVEFVEQCPRAGAEWVKAFGYRCKHGENLEDCQRCMSQTLSELEAEEQ